MHRTWQLQIKEGFNAEKYSVDVYPQLTEHLHFAQLNTIINLVKAQNDVAGCVAEVTRKNRVLFLIVFVGNSTAVLGGDPERGAFFAKVTGRV